MSTTPVNKFGYQMQKTPTKWNFSGDPKITGGKSFCDFTVNPNGSVTCKPRGPYANLYFWAEHPAPQPCSIWMGGYQVLVDDYSVIQQVEYDGQIQLNNWLYNFGLSLDREDTKKARFFQYKEVGKKGFWDSIGDLNMADFTAGKPVQMASAFAVDMNAHTITLLGLTTTNAEYKPNLVHAAYYEVGLTPKQTQGGQIDFDGSGKGATFTILTNAVLVC